MRAALAGDSHQEVSKGVVELPDVTQHSHGADGDDARNNTSIQSVRPRHTVRRF